MPTYTPNYDFALPLVDNATDQDLWGAQLNANFTALDTLLPTITVVPGAIMLFPASNAPNGYLECNGQEYSRTTYAALWAFAQASGNIVADAAWNSSLQYGCFSTGDGSTNFRIPLLTGLFVRGWDHGFGVDPSRPLGSYQLDTIASHTHTVNDPGHTHPLSGNVPTTVGSPALPTSGPNNYGVITATQSSTTGITVNAAGAVETRPKNVALMYCIKY